MKLLALLLLLPALAAPQGRVDATFDLTGWRTLSTGLSTSTTLVELVPATSGSRIYVKSWKCSSSAAATTTANEQCRLKSGTGTNCGTATVEVDGCFNPALGGCLGGELVLPAGHALCVQHAAAGSKIFTVTYKKGP